MDLFLLTLDIQELPLQMEVESVAVAPSRSGTCGAALCTLDWREQRALWAELSA